MPCTPLWPHKHIYYIFHNAIQYKIIYLIRKHHLAVLHARQTQCLAIGDHLRVLARVLKLVHFLRRAQNERAAQATNLVMQRLSRARARVSLDLASVWWAFARVSFLLHEAIVFICAKPSRRSKHLSAYGSARAAQWKKRKCECDDDICIDGSGIYILIGVWWSGTPPFSLHSFGFSQLCNIFCGKSDYDLCNSNTYFFVNQCYFN